MLSTRSVELLIENPDFDPSQYKDQLETMIYHDKQESVELFMRDKRVQQYYGRKRPVGYGDWQNSKLQSAIFDNDVDQLKRILELPHPPSGLWLRDLILKALDRGRYEVTNVLLEQRGAFRDNRLLYEAIDSDNVDFVSVIVSHPKFVLRKDRVGMMSSIVNHPNRVDVRELLRGNEKTKRIVT